MGIESKQKLTATVHVRVKVHLSIWDAIKIRISGFPTLKNVIDITTEGETK